MSAEPRDKEKLSEAARELGDAAKSIYQATQALLSIHPLAREMPVYHKMVKLGGELNELVRELARVQL